MPSQLKSDTSRANGAKSHGPKSAETRAISSRNSVSHGLTSRHTTVLECENLEEFEEILASHFATYQPANPAQENLVNEMVSAQWRIRRARIVETTLLELELLRNQDKVEKEYVEPDSGIHLAEAFRTLIDDSRALSLMSRYESRLHRMHERAYRTLRELQREPHSEECHPAEALRPEPEPEPPIAQPEAAVEPTPTESKNDETNPRPALSLCVRPSRTPQTHESISRPFPVLNSPLVKGKLLRRN